MLVLSLADVNAPPHSLKVANEIDDYVVVNNFVAHLLRIVLHLL